MLNRVSPLFALIFFFARPSLFSTTVPRNVSHFSPFFIYLHFPRTPSSRGPSPSCRDVLCSTSRSCTLMRLLENALRIGELPQCLFFFSSVVFSLLSIDWPCLPSSLPSHNRSFLLFVWGAFPSFHFRRRLLCNVLSFFLTLPLFSTSLLSRRCEIEKPTLVSLTPFSEHVAPRSTSFLPVERFFFTNSYHVIEPSRVLLAHFVLFPPPSMEVLSIAPRIPFFSYSALVPTRYLLLSLPFFFPPRFFLLRSPPPHLITSVLHSCRSI